LKRLLARARALLAAPRAIQQANDEVRLLVGQVLAQSAAATTRYASLADLEFRVFSQFGDDGIIHYLTRNLPLIHRTFIEFGVDDYFESNTRFLLQNGNWSGFVMDGSPASIERLTRSAFYWKHDLTAKVAFVTRENVRGLLADAIREWDGVDLLHIDIDGNDYWVWKEIDLKPSVVIVEYNSTFGIDRAITIPYNADFYRTQAHFSNLYWGSSLKALCLLALEKGYRFIGCNGAGNNAYFLRGDLVSDRIPAVSPERGFVKSKYRESRDEAGGLTYLSARDRTQAIRGLPVFDVELGMEVAF
jgi:hypothetical protein